MKKEREKIPGIYAIYNINKKMYYIGSSKDTANRIKRHFSDLKKNRHHNINMQKDYNAGDQFKAEIIYSMIIDNRRELLRTESCYIREYKRNGILLYNTGRLDDPGYVNHKAVVSKMADMFCLEKYGMTVDKFLTQCEAKITMEYELLVHPEMEDRIRAELEPVIKYHNMQNFCRTHYNMTYEEYHELTAEQRKSLYHNKRGRRNAV